MRGALPTGFLILALATGCWGENSSPPTTPPAPPPAPEAQAATPSWVPAPTPQQRELLAPLKRPIQTPAARVFPDLSRFGYAPSRPLASPADALKFTKMVTQVLNDSPRFYTLGEAPAEAANLVAQYGPNADQPDGFKVAKPRDGGLLDLAAVPGADAARKVLASGDKLWETNDLAGAIFAYREAITRSAGSPGPRVALALALKKMGKASEAEAALKEAIAIDPTFAPAHLGLAEMAEQRGDLAAARRALVEALAYHPAAPRALELAKRIGGGAGAGGWTDAPAAAGSGRVSPMRVFLDVDDKGAIHVATAKSDAAQIYGGCRAIMRHEPDVREQLFRQPKDVPYYLSVGEEVVCLEAAIGAYHAAKGSGQPASPEMEALTRLASEDGLSGYAMFEILGQRRPERARTAPADVHRDVAAYVDKHVLSRKTVVAPDAPYTAAR